MSHSESVQPAPASIEAAKIAGLRYVSDNKPGITRKRSGKSFVYRTPDGKALRDRDALARIRSLVIPPAWTGVWICPIENGHIQVTARDARGRKQYRYHTRWRQVRDENKYEKMAAFGRMLPKIRERVAADLELRGLPREKVLATVVRLLEATCMRVGNERYARDNQSFGLTTLRDQHVKVSGEHIKFSFRGKSGKHHNLELNDRRLARIVRNCRDLPGYELFQYLDADGEQHVVDAQDVNDYLKAITGDNFTAKDFRTWSGTVLAAYALHELEKFDSKAQAKKNIVRAIEAVATQLGNTPSICRKCYIHPEIINAYLDGEMVLALKRRAEKKLNAQLHSLRPEEAAVLTLLQQRLQQDADLVKQLKARPKRRAHGKTTRRPSKVSRARASVHTARA